MQKEELAKRGFLEFLHAFQSVLNLLWSDKEQKCS